MANYFVTSLGAGLKDGTSWSNAFDTAGFIASAKIQDGVYFIRGGETYVITESFTLDQYRPCLIGVKPTTTATPPDETDFAYGSDRPTLSCGAYTITNASWGGFYNLIAIGSGENVLYGANSYDVIFNCSVVNTSLLTTSRAINNFETVKFCAASCPNGMAIRGGAVKYCYVYDSTDGIGVTVSTNFSIAKNITLTGISTHGYGQNIMSYNTVYGCTTGLQHITNGSEVTIDNNQIINCVTGISTYNYRQIIISGNNFYNISGSRVSNSGVTEISYTELDPMFVDPANADFRPQNKNLIGKAYPETFQGTNTPNKSVAGAVQIDASAGGSVSGGRIGIGAGIGR